MSNRPSGAPVPPRQQNFDVAAARALEAARSQTPEQLEWLGARREHARLRLGVLGGSLSIDLETGDLRSATGEPVGPWWRVLALHYLAVQDRPDEQEPSLTFAELPGGRSYAPVYRGRVIQRLCHTAGRDEATLRHGAEALGADPAEGGDVALDFQVFPRLRLRMVWYAGDDELPPSATLLLPANIESWFCIEDIVVLSERLVAGLGGAGF